MAFCRIATVSDVWDGDFLPCDAAGTRVLVVKLDGTIHAYEDRCAHLGVPLSEGSLEDGVLTCSAHRYQYDARTGCGKNPASVRLRRFPVKVEEGQILVDIGEAPK